MIRPHKSPIPLTVVTGFLGAGKTTLLNRLLREPAMAETAIIVNEFGDVGLDHLLVERAADGIIELSAGCVCCTIRGELVDALERLLRAIDNRRVGAVRRVVVETTGLADPAPIVHVLTRHPYLRLRYAFDGIITTVDAVHGAPTLDAYDEAERQVAIADRIVITKTDLVGGDTSRLTARLAALNPGAPILDAACGEAVAAALVGGSPFDEFAKAEDVRRWLADEAVADHHAHHQDVSRHGNRIFAFAIIRAASMAPATLAACLDRLALDHGERLIRVKGLIGLADDAARPAVIHGVQGQFTPPRRLASWPDSDRRSRVVVIGRDLARQPVERLFDVFFGELRPDSPDRAALIDNPLAIAGFQGERRY